VSVEFSFKVDLGCSSVIVELMVWANVLWQLKMLRRSALLCV